jgi:hypothetical protein
VQIHRHGVALEHAAPAVAEADDLVAVGPDPLAHHGTDDRVETRAVAAAGQDADPHVLLPGTFVAGPVLLGVMMPQRKDPCSPPLAGSGRCPAGAMSVA